MANAIFASSVWIVPVCSSCLAALPPLQLPLSVYTKGTSRPGCALWHSPTQRKARLEPQAALSRHFSKLGSGGRS